MSEGGGMQFESLLARARRRWLLACGLDAMAGALLAGAIVGALTRGAASATTGAALLAVLGVAVVRWKNRWPVAAQLARHLDATVPEVGWSTELVLANPGELSALGRRQRERVNQALVALDTPRLPPRTWRLPTLRLLGVALACAVLWAALRSGRTAIPAAEHSQLTVPAPTALSLVRVEVDPPRYTRLQPHVASGWAVRAEEGALVKFEFAFTGPVDHVVVRFGEQDQSLLREGGHWRIERRFAHSELFALVAANDHREVVRGPLGRLEVVPDRPPTVEVLHPGPLTLVPAPVAGGLDLEVSARDDYGVAGVEARLVLARGVGEGVTFRELKREMKALPGGRYVDRLDLAALGLAPDVELFLRFEARDNREPEPGRTQTSMLRIRMARPDEKPTVSLAAGLALPPVLAMFRSERQIIIDTERLLRERRSLTAEKFQDRAQSIGFDQRALRLRYGALLGQEVESGLAVEAAAAEVTAARKGTAATPGATSPGKPATPADPAAPGEEEESAPQRRSPEGPPAPSGGSAEALAAQLPAGMVHLHDSAETSTFLPEALRQEMRDVLNEMWGAEGRLRGIDPQGALGFENRALQKLKDVQQRARVYVAKVSYQAPELDPSRRLKGEVTAVRGQESVLEPLAPDRLLELFAWSEGICSQPRSSAAPPPLAAAAAEAALSKAALGGDDEALRALQVWRASPQPGCRASLEIRAALWHLLKAPAPPIGRAAGEP